MNVPTTKYEYDASGQTTARIETDGDTFLATTFEFDPAGRVVEVVEPGGVSVGYAYSDGGRRGVATRPGQDAVVLETYADGRPKSVSGGGDKNRCYEYGADPDGIRCMKILWAPAIRGNGKRPRSTGGKAFGRRETRVRTAGRRVRDRRRLRRIREAFQNPSAGRRALPDTR